MVDLLVNNTALFRKDHLVGYLSSEEGKFYNYCTRGFSYTVFPLKNPSFSAQGNLSVRLRGNPLQIEAIPTREGLLLSIKADVTFDINEDTSFIKQDEHYFNALEKTVNENLINQLRQLIEHTQQEKLDVFNVADRLHAMQPEVWRQVKNNWPDVYSKLPIKIEADARYRDSSTMTTGPGYKE